MQPPDNNAGDASHARPDRPAEPSTRSHAVSSRHQPRRLRFSLRTLLLVPTLVAGLLTVWYQRFERPRRVVEQLDHLGANVEFADSGPPGALRTILDACLPRAYLDDIQFVSLDPAITAQGLKTFAALPRLPALHLLEPDSSALDPLLWDALAELRELHVSVYDNTNDFLRCVARLRRLDTLKIDGSIREADLAYLVGVTSLQELNLAGSSASDECLVHVGRLVQLRRLALDGTSVTEYGMRHLTTLTLLESLSLTCTGVGGEGCAQLRCLPSLKSLSLGGIEMPLESVAQLGQLTSLQHLCLCECSVTDAGLASLSELQDLRSLWLDNSELTDESMSHLLSFPLLTELRLSGNNITDAAIPILGELTQLKELRLAETEVSAVGIAQLKSALPQCRIDW